MNKISMTLLRIAAVAAVGSGFAVAQPLNVVSATIPFDFHAGRTAMPAGQYTMTASLQSGCLQIRNTEGKAQTALMTINAATPSSPAETRLTFRVYGDSHYLASVWNGSTGEGQDLLKTPAEREAEMAGIPARVTVLIARK